MPKNCVAIFVNRARRVANARPLAGTSSSSSSSSSSWSSRHLPSRGAIASSVLSSRSRGRLFLSFVFVVASVTTTTIRLDARCCLGCHSSSRLSRAPRHIIRACTLHYSTKKMLVFLLVGRAQKRALFVTHVLFTLLDYEVVFQKGEFLKGKSPTKKNPPSKKMFRVWVFVLDEGR